MEIVFHLLLNLGRLLFSKKVEVVFLFPNKLRSSSNSGPGIFLLSHLINIYWKMLENKLSRVGVGLGGGGCWINGK